MSGDLTDEELAGLVFQDRPEEEESEADARARYHAGELDPVNVPAGDVVKLRWFDYFVAPEGAIIPGWYVIGYEDTQDPEDPEEDPRIVIYVSNVSGGPDAIAAFAADLAGMLNRHGSTAIREPNVPAPIEDGAANPTEPTEGEPT